MALRAEGANRNCPTFPPGDGIHRVNLAEHPGSQHRIRHFISLQTGELEVTVHRSTAHDNVTS
jgi:hypothetical protein